jgi:hypothetical protein
LSYLDGNIRTGFPVVAHAALLTLTSLTNRAAVLELDQVAAFRILFGISRDVVAISVPCLNEDGVRAASHDRKEVAISVAVVVHQISYQRLGKASFQNTDKGT